MILEQLIYYVDFCDDVGVDGFVRMFDFRYLEYFIIIYEDVQYYFFLRFCWNKQDFNYLVTMVMDVMEVERFLLLDIMVNFIYVN